jgi:L-lysine exporter family protein LysE/ArgO
MSTHVSFRVTALTFLDPHVYLDAVLLLGSLAAHEGPRGGWWFAAGAAAASLPVDVQGSWFGGSLPSHLNQRSLTT